VDDQPAHFTVERLHQLKRDHEALEALRSGPVRLIADPAKPSPKVFVACFKGDTLWSHVQGSHSMQSLVAANLNDEQGDEVAELQTAWVTRPRHGRGFPPPGRPVSTTRPRRSATHSRSCFSRDSPDPR
jgi:hypothetical protein